MRQALRVLFMMCLLLVIGVVNSQETPTPEPLPSDVPATATVVPTIEAPTTVPTVFIPTAEPPTNTATATDIPPTETATELPPTIETATATETQTLTIETLTATATLTLSSPTASATSTEMVLEADAPLEAQNLMEAQSLVEDCAPNKNIYLANVVTGGAIQGNEGVEAYVNTSSDGRYSVFEGLSTNLVAGDANVVGDIFRFDRVTCTTVRISISTTGGDPNGESLYPDISSDGNFVVFMSYANNLVANDTNGKADLFIRDVNAGTTTRILSNTGVQANDDTGLMPVFSNDNRYIAYSSKASNFSGAVTDSNNTWDVFLYDRNTNSTQLVTKHHTNNTTVTPSAGATTYPNDAKAVWVLNGTPYVLFAYNTTDLVVGMTALQGVFLKNMSVGQVTLMSVTTGGIAANNTSVPVGIYADSANITVLFGSIGLNMNPLSNMGLYKRVVSTSSPTVGTTTAINFSSVPRSWIMTTLSNDGRYGFISIDTTTAPATPKENGYILNLTTNQFTLLVNGDAGTNYGTISADGQYVVAKSYASNLVPVDTNTRSDAFVIKNTAYTAPVATPTPMPSATPTATATSSVIENCDPNKNIWIASVGTGGTPLGNDSSYAYSSLLSGSGRYVIYDSSATNLVANDTNNFSDVFRFDLQTCTTERVSVSDTEQQANNESSMSYISSDGRYVAFTSWASNLVANDTNNQGDIFLRDMVSQTTLLVSKNAQGQPANNQVLVPVISNDNRYILYASKATNLVTTVSDTNQNHDLFLFDWFTNTTKLVTKHWNGTSTYNTGILDTSKIDVWSVNGVPYVMFNYTGSDIVQGAGGVSQVYLRNMSSDQVWIVSRTDADLPTDGNSSGQSLGINANGLVLLFNSSAPNLNAGSPAQLYIRNISMIDPTLGTTSPVPWNVSNSSRTTQNISVDGRYGLFEIPQPNQGSNAYIVNLETGASQLVIDRQNGEPNQAGVVSDDGRYIAFMHIRNGLVLGDNNNLPDIFVIKNPLYIAPVATPTPTQTPITPTATSSVIENCDPNKNIWIASVGTGGTPLGNGNSVSYYPMISSGGRYAVFASDATNLVPNDTNGKYDVFRFDRIACTIQLVSVATNGQSGNDQSDYPDISADGRYVVFTSDSTNLVANDTNNKRDIFLRDMTTGTTQLISKNSQGQLIPNSAVGLSVISEDGQYVLFASKISLAPLDTDSMVDWYLYNRLSNAIELVSYVNNADIDVNIFNRDLVVVNGIVYVLYSEVKTGYLQQNLYLKNMTSGEEWLVGRNDADEISNGEISGISLGYDGTNFKIVFTTVGTNFSPLATSKHYMRTVPINNPTVGTTIPIALPGGTGSIGFERVSSDSRYALVAKSYAPQNPNLRELYAVNLNTGQSQLLDANITANFINGNISPDGAYVVFGSPNGSLVPNDTNNFSDAFIMKNPLYIAPVSTPTPTPSLTPVGTYTPLPVAINCPINSTTWLASIGDTRNQLANQDSTSFTRLSADGRYVVFGSVASNLVPNDTNNVSDVFRFDRQTCQIMRVSVTTDGTQLSAGAGLPDISPDGRYVVFVSDATNLVANDTNNFNDIFVRDMVANTTVLISKNNQGQQTNNISYLPAFVGNQHILYISSATNLSTVNDNNTPRAGSDLFLYNMATQTVQIVSDPSDPSSYADLNLYSGVIVNGDVYVLYSQIVDITQTLYLRNMTTGTRWAVGRNDADQLSNGDTVALSLTVSGSNFNIIFADDGTNTSPVSDTGLYSRVVPINDPITGNTRAINLGLNPFRFYFDSISADGRYAFVRVVNSLYAVAPDDLYIVNLETGQKQLVSISYDYQAGEVSADGQYFTFTSDSPVHFAGDVNGFHDAFIMKNPLYTAPVATPTPTQTSTPAPIENCDPNKNIWIASVGSGGTPLGNGNSVLSYPVVSNGGRYAFFASDASNLVPNDTNGKSDVFRFDRISCTMQLVSVATNGQMGNAESDYPDISADGRYVVFRSEATNLVANDTNNAIDIFLRDMVNGTTTRISKNNQGQQANGISGFGRISEDGQYVLFDSTSSNFSALDTDTGDDWYLYNRLTDTVELVWQIDNGNTANLFFRDIVVVNGVVYVLFSEYGNDSPFNYQNLYLKNMSTGEAWLVGRNDADEVSNGSIFGVSLTHDGTNLKIIFWSDGTNFSPIPASGYYLRTVPINNPTIGTTVAIDLPGGTASFYLEQVSSDSRYTVVAKRYDPQNPNLSELYVVNLNTGQSELLVTDTTVNFTDGNISLDGEYIVFGSFNDSLVPNDTNNFSDAFIMKNPLYAPIVVPPAPTITASTLMNVGITLPLQGNSGTAPYTYSNFSTSGNGVITPNGDTWVYTPKTGFVGNDTFTYTVTSANGIVANGNIIVSVTNVTVMNPVHLSTISAARPTFSWSAITGGARYRLQVDNNADFSSPEINLLNASTVYTLPITQPALAQGTYYWRVGATDINGTTPPIYSPTVQFNIFIGVSPAPNAISLSKQIVFSWTPVAGCTHGIEFNTSANFNGQNIYPPAVAGAASLSITLDFGTYYWRAVACNQLPGNAVVRKLTISPPTVTPVQISPASGAFLNTRTPTLGWNATINTETYEVQVDNTPTFTTELEFTGTTNTLSLVTTTLPEGLYYWRVRSINAYGASSLWSGYRTFTVDMTPLSTLVSLSSPLENTLTANARQPLYWVPLAGASRYEVIVSQDSQCVGTPIPSVSTAYTPIPSLTQGRWYWCVRAFDPAGNVGAWSAVRSFVVNIQVIPADKTVFISTNNIYRASLLWTAVVGATNYTVEVDNVADFSSPDSYTVTPTSFYLPALPNGTHYWRVRSNLETTWAHTRSFSITPTVPVGPTIIAPVAASYTNTSPIIQWQAISGITRYDLQYSTNSGFLINAPLVSVENTTQYALPALPANANALYYYRVRAINAFGAVGAWSTLRYFIYDTVAPIKPTLYSPVNNSTTTTARPVIYWSPITGAKNYQYIIDTDSACDATPSAPAPATYLSLTTNLAQGTYFWCARAIDFAGNIGEYSLPFSFTVNSLTSPSNGMVYAVTTPTYRPVVYWTLMTGVTSYTVQVDDNSQFSSPDSYPVGNISYYQLPALPYGTYYWQVIPAGFAQTAPVYRSFVITPNVPVAPKLVAPTTASQTNNRTPTLKWEAIVNITRYEVQWSPNAAFTTNLGTQIVDNVTQITVPQLPETAATLYYWRVRGINSFGAVGAWSGLFYFTLDTVLPAAPILSSPLNNAISATARPILYWGGIVGAKNYELIIDTDNLCDATALAPQVSTAYAIPSNLPQGKYFWCVRTTDLASNVGAYSLPFSFTVNILSSPADATMFTSVGNIYAPTVYWTPMTGVTTYTVQVDDNPQFSSPDSYNVGNTSYYRLPALANGTYYWQVIPTGFAQTAPVSRRFTITPVAPIAPIITQPTLALITNVREVRMVWQAITGITRYEVQWSTNPAFTTVLNSQIVDNVTEFTTPSLPESAGTIWYYRVRGINPFNAVGAWSTLRYVTLDTVAPIKPTLLSPVQLGVIATRTPFITWNITPTATRYILEISRNNTFTQLVINNTLIATSYTISPTQALSNGKYYWRVVAFDAAGNRSVLSDVFVFTVDAP